MTGVEGLMEPAAGWAVEAPVFPVHLHDLVFVAARVRVGSDPLRPHHRVAVATAAVDKDRAATVIVGLVVAATGKFGDVAGEHVPAHLVVGAAATLLLLAIRIEEGS